MPLTLPPGFSKSLTSSRYEYWVTDGQNPNGHKPVCNVEYEPAAPIIVRCHWDVGRHDDKSNLTTFKSYLSDNFSSVVTASNSGDMEASLPKKDMNFGWAGSLDFKMYNPKLCQTAGEVVPTQTYHMYYVLGQTGTGGLAKLLYDTYKTASKVMKCVEEADVGDENPKCEVKVVKSFDKLGDDLEKLWDNVWSIATLASKSGNPYKNIDEALKYASKIVKTDLTASGIGNTALVGYLQDDQGNVDEDLQYSIRQSSSIDNDHSMDLILSQKLLQRVYNAAIAQPICSKDDVKNAASATK